MRIILICNDNKNDSYLCALPRLACTPDIFSPLLTAKLASQYDQADLPMSRVPFKQKCPYYSSSYYFASGISYVAVSTT